MWKDFFIFLEDNFKFITSIISLLGLSGWIKFFLERRQRKKESRNREQKERILKILELIRNEKTKFTYLKSYKAEDAFRYFKYAIVRTISGYKNDIPKIKSEFSRMLNDENHTSSFKSTLIYELLNIIENLNNNKDKQFFLNYFNIELTNNERIYLYHLIKYKDNLNGCIEKYPNIFYISNEVKSLLIEDINRNQIMNLFDNKIDTEEVAEKTIKELVVV